MVFIVVGPSERSVSRSALFDSARIVARLPGPPYVTLCNNWHVALTRLATLLAWAMCSAFRLAEATRVPYVLCSDNAGLRRIIYSLSGQVFWRNLYALSVLGASAAVIGVDFERRAKGKIFFQKDMLIMAPKLYQDTTSASFDKAPSVAFPVTVTLFSASFGLHMSLGVLKSFIPK